MTGASTSASASASHLAGAGLHGTTGPHIPVLRRSGRKPGVSRGAGADSRLRRQWRSRGQVGVPADAGFVHSHAARNGVALLADGR